MTESWNSPQGGSGFSRRDFLRGSGAVAAATSITVSATQAAEESTGSVPILRDATRIKLDVNGQVREVLAEPRTTLLEVLRYQLDLTGAKPVSGDGTSGAATVMVDGKPMCASTLLAVACVGRKVRTAESLGGEKPDAVCRAFAEHDATQCGFCTPGFVVAVRAFLDKHPQATEAEIRGGLNGNLCRCGTYANIIQAAVAVVKGGT